MAIKIFSLLCLIPALLCGMIFESDKMDDLMAYVDEETWVFIDIDNTLIEPCLQLGSTQWWRHIRQKARNLGCSKEEAQSIADRFWLFVQPFVPVRLVDPNASDLVKRLKELNIRTLALTARGYCEWAHTRKQLASVDVSFFSSDFPERTVLPANELALLDEGVIYCGENTKGQALTAFLNIVGHTPKKIIFIDDKPDQVVNLEQTLVAMGVAFVGIRFSGADERVKAFDGDVADIQFSLLPKVVTDEEAKLLLLTSSSP